MAIWTARRWISTCTPGRPQRGERYVHLRDQLAVPPQDRLRRDQRRNLGEHSTAQALAEDRETPPFVVTQLQPSTVQLSLERRNSITSRCCPSSHPKSAAAKRCNGITAPV
jgi:hypothetical protein